MILRSSPTRPASGFAQRHRGQVARHDVEVGAKCRGQWLCGVPWAGPEGGTWERVSRKNTLRGCFTMRTHTSQANARQTSVSSSDSHFAQLHDWLGRSERSVLCDEEMSRIREFGFTNPQAALLTRDTQFRHDHLNQSRGSEALMQTRTSTKQLMRQGLPRGRGPC